MTPTGQIALSSLLDLANFKFDTFFTSFDKCLGHLTNPLFLFCFDGVNVQHGGMYTWYQWSADNVLCP